MAEIPLHPIVAALPASVPFVGPETIERASGIAFRARMGANESPFGPSPKVIAALTAAATEIGRYGDSDLFALKAALSQHLGVATDAITIGEGIDGIFGTLCRIVLAPGDTVVTSRGSYPTFLYHALAQGAQVEAVPYDGMANDLARLSERARALNARVVFLANPDNPTGSAFAADALEDFIAAVPETTLVVLDEAYAEFAGAGEVLPGTFSRPNLIRTRTFSKAHGLAGMRIGYAFGPSGLIGAFDRVRNHFGVTRLGQVAALAALEDSAWTAQVVADTRRGLAEITAIAKRNGLLPLPTATNFVAIDGGRDGAFAEAIVTGLAAEGIFIRKPKAEGLAQLIRVSIGSPAEVALLAETLPRVLSHLRAGYPVLLNE